MEENAATWWNHRGTFRLQGTTTLTTATIIGKIETSHLMAIQTMELSYHHIMKFQTPIL